MAVKWAVANGAWSAGATWNDGVAPTSSDDVYLNGHSFAFNNSAFYAKTISNEAVDSLGIVAGGNIQLWNYTLNNSKDFIAQDVPILKLNNCVGNLQFDGNLTGINAPVIQIGSDYVNNNINIVVNGNVSGNFFIAEYNTSILKTLTLNGNCHISKFFETTNTVALTTLTINGLATFSDIGDVTITSLNVVGNLTMNNGVVKTTNLTINGQINYKNNNNIAGVLYQNLTILNPDTFTWKDITEPRSNQFIIVTDAEMNNRQQYPSENEVKEGTEYIWGEKVGTYTPDYPPESVVLKDYEYGDSDDRKTGTMVQEVNVEVGCVTPEDVRKDVPLVGMGVVGTLVVPSVDDVREGVVFDNGSVGTLIVQGGGDRLRIADFGYYTNAQSDTYIVDLTEQDKPKFAVAEERVLIEMFPDLDLDNIPEKYFDDLFVKYLKYRLIVEYYRTAGINSTFTPSEPTTEIVNYQNVRNEVWLNSANIYLKAWLKKFPESITKPQRILL